MSCSGLWLALHAYAKHQNEAEVNLRTEERMEAFESYIEENIRLRIRFTLLMCIFAVCGFCIFAFSGLATFTIMIIMAMMEFTGTITARIDRKLCDDYMFEMFQRGFRLRKE